MKNHTVVIAEDGQKKDVLSYTDGEELVTHIAIELSKSNPDAHVSLFIDGEHDRTFFRGFKFVDGYVPLVKADGSPVYASRKVRHTGTLMVELPPELLKPHMENDVPCLR